MRPRTTHGLVAATVALMLGGTGMGAAQATGAPRPPAGTTPAAATPSAAATSAAGKGPAGTGSVGPGTAHVWQAGTHRYVLRLRAGAVLAQVLAAVTRVGGRVVAVQPAFGTLVADLDAGAARTIAARADLAGVAADRSVATASLGYDPTTQAGSMTNVTRVTGAQAMWRAGYTGSGVDVAVIDTGVAPVPSLASAVKVVVGPDLSFESQDPALRHLDSFGHGTHMAGIIAGRERGTATGSTYASDVSNYYGMAPDARLVSIKLADHDGAVDVSQVIAALDWVVQNRRNGGLNIRVVNLSFGTPSTQSPQTDPLSWAAEVAWHAGIVVVASGGNDGVSSAGLADPAYNPWLIAVGAADTKGTDARTDDTVAPFSARPGGAGGTRGVDLVAPGVGIVAPGVPGSAIYAAYSGARVGNGLLRGSGTSQAAAVVSGAVALLLSQHPFLDPDQVKATLRAGATRLAGSAANLQGSGELTLSPTAGTVLLPPLGGFWGHGTGTLEGARGGFHVSLNSVDLRGERDIMGDAWNSAWLATLAQTSLAWSLDGEFNGATWIGTGFVADTTTVAGKTWSGKTWAGKTWSGKTWSGQTWTGKTWSSAVWTGSGWSSASWSHATSMVSDTGWTGSVWSTAGWS